jgi:hypothetical protein
LTSYTANPFPVMKTGVPAIRTGVPCNENRFFPVWKTSQGKPCYGPVLALYRIAVHRSQKRPFNSFSKTFLKKSVLYTEIGQKI